MIWKGEGIIKLENGEPALRSCWECNQAHERLKKVNTLHHCLWCSRHWVFDRFMDSFETEEEFDSFFEEKGMSPGDSTTSIDAGYRIMVLQT